MGFGTSLCIYIFSVRVPSHVAYLVRLAFYSTNTVKPLSGVVPIEAMLLALCFSFFIAFRREVRAEESGQEAKGGSAGPRSPGPTGPPAAASR